MNRSSSKTLSQLIHLISQAQLLAEELDAPRECRIHLDLAKIAATPVVDVKIPD